MVQDAEPRVGGGLVRAVLFSSMLAPRPGPNQHGGLSGQKRIGEVLAEGVVGSAAVGPVARAEQREAFEAPFSGSADVNFTGTAYRGGILDGRHNGVSVPYAPVTGSGVDLTQSLRPVRLPAALGLLASGRGALIGRVRRRW